MSSWAVWRLECGDFSLIHGAEEGESPGWHVEMMSGAQRSEGRPVKCDKVSFSFDLADVSGFFGIDMARKGSVLLRITLGSSVVNGSASSSWESSGSKRTHSATKQSHTRSKASLRVVKYRTNIMSPEILWKMPRRRRKVYGSYGTLSPTYSKKSSLNVRRFKKLRYRLNYLNCLKYLNLRLFAGT